MKRRSVFFQIYLIYIILTTVFISIMTFFSIESLKKVIYEKEIRRQLDTTIMAAGQLKQYVVSGGQDVESFCKTMVSDLDYRITVIDENGGVLADTHYDIELMNNHNDRPEIRQADNKGIGHSIRYSSTLAEVLLYTAVKVPETNMNLRMATSIDDIKNTISSVYVTIGVIALLTLLGTGLASYLVGRRYRGFFEGITKTASEYARGDFSTKIAGGLGSSETYNLSQSLNAMARQLREKINTINFQKNELKMMLNSMTEPVILLDHKLLIRDMNPAAIGLVRFKLHECLGRSIIQIIRNIPLCDLAEEVVATGEKREQLILLNEETDHYWLTRLTPIIHPSEELVSHGVLLVFNDVSEMKRLDNMRRDFVANVSHELKTPITSIQGYVETLQAGIVKDPEKVQEFLGVIRRQSARLNTIVTELLTLSRIEDDEGRQIPKEDVSLASLIKSAVNSCRSQAEETGTEILTEVDDKIRFKVQRLLIEQAVANLIENAIKYGDRGQTVRISGMRKGSEILIEVQDSGWGIPTKDLPRIFERFYRVDKARSRELGGTGLGLAIVKHIMIVHGGNVSVDSQIGKGSAFTLHFPDA